MSWGNVWNAFKNAAKGTMREVLEDNQEEEPWFLNLPINELLEDLINDPETAIDIKRDANSLQRRQLIKKLEKYCADKNPLKMPLVKEQEAIDRIKK